jgi:signal peptidase II
MPQTADNASSAAIPLRTRAAVLAAILVAVIALDQLTKVYAIRHLRGAGRSSYLGDTLRIEYAENPGAFLSLGRNLSPSTRYGIFVVLNASFLVAVAAFAICHRKLRMWELAALGLLLAGGVGNLIDRITKDGHVVVDLMNLGIGGLRTGIFNVADVAITSAALMLLMAAFVRTDSDKKGTT